MPSSASVAEPSTADADLFDDPAPESRRRSSAKNAREDADDFGFGGGLGDDDAGDDDPPAKPARKRATKKKASSKTPAKTAKAKADGEAKKKTATRKRAATKTAAKKAPARKRAAKKAEPEEIEDDPLADFGGFGDDDAPPVPINPSATASVKPRAKSVTADDFGGRVSVSGAAAKALAAEKLAAKLELEDGSKKKKTRRGRRNKKDRQTGEAQPAAAAAKSGGPKRGGGEVVSGVLEMHPKGYGFLRDATNNYVAQESDPFVSGALVDRFRLREGVKVVGEVGPGSRGQGPRVKLIETVDQVEPEEYSDVPTFDSLTPVNPNVQIKLERDQHTVSTRVMDLLTPLGKGQRALIVAPPRSGKTVLLREMADSISHNHPEVHLIVLLIDERPEEVTEMQRSVDGEVIASAASTTTSRVTSA